MNHLQTSPAEAGCSAISWHTEDGCRLWGRNYDFDRLAQGSGMIFLPRNTSYFCVCGPDVPRSPQTSRYACTGTGLLLSPTPLLNEGINEK